MLPILWSMLRLPYGRVPDHFINSTCIFRSVCISNDRHTILLPSVRLGLYILIYQIFYSFVDLTLLHHEQRDVYGVSHLESKFVQFSPADGPVFVSYDKRLFSGVDTCLELSHLPGDLSCPLPIVMLLLLKSFLSETNTAALGVFEVTRNIFCKLLTFNFSGFLQFGYLSQNLRIPGIFYSDRQMNPFIFVVNIDIFSLDFTIFITPFVPFF